MKTARWLDHLPPWMAWGALASTGSYAGAELAAMAVPLLAAAFVEWRGVSLYRFRRLLEIIALGVFLFQVVARTGVLPTVVNTLFVLCGVRLCLPRELPQRRQLLLMGFLLFLTTALSTTELDFLVWSFIWVAGASACLMQFNWARSAQLRQGPTLAAPLRKVPAWTAAVMVMAAGFFVVLPRLHLGLRHLPMGAQSLAGIQAGFSDVIDLSAKGPIQGSTEVVLRIIPGADEADPARTYALLRGLVLEELTGQRWQVSGSTPPRTTASWNKAGQFLEGQARTECFVCPDPRSIIPAPYGRVELEPPEGEQLRAGQGGSIRWWFPVRRTLALKVTVRPLAGEPEPPPTGKRLELLTQPGAGTGSALRWSLRAAPGDLAPDQLATRLTQAFRSFHYATDNPSGGTANPLEDFLERTRTGHCEFFASALAIMLRQRGVAARVVNGYHLGPWLKEGGYFLVTQNEAHSWVEYYDPALRCWRTADPTPPAPPSSFTRSSLVGSLERLADAVRFRWDRNVVRFSDEDQTAGLAWLQARLGALALGDHRPELRAGLLALGILALLAALAWATRTGLPFLRVAAPGSPSRILELRPFLRATGRTAPPMPGETAQAWLGRLSGVRPDRARHLTALAREADAVAYGGKGSTALARMALEEAKAWRVKA